MSVSVLFDLSITAPGRPYQARVVAFTNAGRGEENDVVPFFSQELAATKVPEDVVLNQLSPTSINVTWTPLTLFEAQGFPVYRVTLMQQFNSRRKRQIPDPVITTNNFATINGLDENTQYDAVVGVKTGGTSDYLENIISGM